MPKLRFGLQTIKRSPELSLQLSFDSRYQESKGAEKWSDAQSYIMNTDVRIMMQWSKLEERMSRETQYNLYI